VKEQKAFTKVPIILFKITKQFKKKGQDPPKFIDFLRVLRYHAQLREEATMHQITQEEKVPSTPGFVEKNGGPLSCL